MTQTKHAHKQDTGQCKTRSIETCECLNVRYAGAFVASYTERKAKNKLKKSDKILISKRGGAYSVGLGFPRAACGGSICQARKGLTWML